MSAEFDDPTDLVERDAREAKLAEQRRRARQIEIEDFKALMKTEQGRRFMWRLLSSTGMFQCSFAPTEEVQFRNGMRNVGAIFWSDLHELCPEKYALMTREAQDSVKRIAAER